MEDESLIPRAELVRRLQDLLGADGLLTDPAARRVYARDASHLELGRPLAVALPRTEQAAADVVRLCGAAAVPVVCRGSGTGLSGGAVPADGAVVLGLARLQEVAAVDDIERTALVQAGVLNEALSRRVARERLHFAPDPSSQAAATLGGNIAENAGGPHCLRHGVTLQHLRGLRWTSADGRSWSTGPSRAVRRGIDLVSLLCGSEGTLGVVTAATVNLTPEPNAGVTQLAVFPDLDDAVEAVMRLLSAGLLPVAVEIVDEAMLAAVEEAFAFGFPTDVAAAMIVEFAGCAPEVSEDAERSRSLLLDSGARDVRQAADATERGDLWKCRKKAFGAVGRLTPNYVTMDVVVPLGQLPGLVREIQQIKGRHGVEISTVFHAGDGNLHPGVHYDADFPDTTARAHAAADEIIRAALARDGSVTGEHGVGIEKLHALPWQLDAATADLTRGIKAVFDPTNRLNPGKLIPPTEAEYAPLKRRPRTIEFHWADLTVSAPADTAWAEIQSAAMDRGLWIPVGAVWHRNAEGPGLGTAGTIGEAIDDLLTGPPLVAGLSVRDTLLELWATTGSGTPFHTGAPVAKNVAGYGIGPALCGSGGVLARPDGATFLLRPIPERLALWQYVPAGPVSVNGPVLAQLLDLLTRWSLGPGAPICILETTGDQQVAQLSIIAAGRDRQWDLNRLEQEINAVLTAGGLSLAAKIAVPFDHCAELLAGELLPSWVLGSPDWSVLERCVDSLSDTRPLLPARCRRLIWQAAPTVVWSPDAAPDEPDPAWLADAIWRHGRPTALPEPGSRVPRRLLADLKNLFDPATTLPAPSWLKGPGDV